MGLLRILSNNNTGVDAKDSETKIREKNPLLLGPNEHVEVAFKCVGDGRYKNYFTSHRVLIQIGKGIGEKCKQYFSIPYDNIKAFSVQTTGGSLFETDTELKIWCDGVGHFSPVKIDFAKDEVNLFAVHQFFNQKIFHQAETGTPVTTGATDWDLSIPPASSWTVDTIFNWLGDDARQIDIEVVEEKFGFGAESPVLMPYEQVEVAYKARRDVIVLTPTRFFFIDVKGWSGKKIEFFSMRWSCVKAFSVETAGNFDRDSEFVLRTNIPEIRRIHQDLRDSKADIFQIQKIFANKILGRKCPLIPGLAKKKDHVDPGALVFDKFKNRYLDKTEVENVFRSSPCLLQEDEDVEMAFRGLRDLVIFTTKRILHVDVKGWSGKKVRYTSIPWSSILAFGVNTAVMIDRDNELRIYTEIKNDPPPGEDKPPDPGMSYLKFDFNKKFVKILDLKRYLAARLLSTERDLRVPPSILAAASNGEKMEVLLSKLGDNESAIDAIDATELNIYLHRDVDLLLEDENVVLAFKAGRDISCFTNKRIFVIDKQRFSGKRIEYTSVPYSSIRAFSSESAGSWDRDSELVVYTKNYWSLNTLKLDFRKGKADIIAINNLLSAAVVGSQQDAENYLKTANPNTVRINHSGAMDSFSVWAKNFSVEEDPTVADAQFHNDPPILLENERVEKVYREGRDLWVYTTMRILRVDVKGIGGKKVSYLSIPIDKSVTAFGVETAGRIAFDAEAYFFTNVPALAATTQKLLIKSGNIFDIHKYFGNRMLKTDE